MEEIKKVFGPIVDGFKAYKAAISNLKDYEAKEGENPIEETWKNFLLEAIIEKINIQVEQKRINYWNLFDMMKEALDYVSKETEVEFSDNDKHIINAEGFKWYVSSEDNIAQTLSAAKDMKEQIKKQMATATTETQKTELKKQLDQIKEVEDKLKKPN